MTADTIRGFLNREPFAPFTIRLSDGRRFDVKHPEFVAVHPEVDTMAILFLPRGRFEFICLRNVTGVQSEGEAPSLPRRRRRGNGDEP